MHPQSAGSNGLGFCARSDTVATMAMFPFKARALFLNFLVVVAGPIPALAWDAGGHELVASVAWDRLNPKARNEVAQLTREIANPEKAYTPISVSCWMDDIRKGPADMPYHGMFASWHYIDIPIDSRDPMPAFEPGDDTDEHGNVVQALKRAVTVLRGGADPYIKSKAIACAMVMHLVGDIHQPLHCATKYFLSGGQLHQDNGGNKEEVINGPPASPGSPPFNLHYFWDAAYRASFDSTSGNVAFDPECRIEEIKAVPLPPNAKLDPDFDQWAKESNAIARDFVYPDITATDNRKLCRLSSEYVAKARTIARGQLLLAGYRLAALLNGIFNSQ